MKIVKTILLLVGLLSSMAMAQELLIIPSKINFHGVREGSCRNTNVNVVNNGVTAIPKPGIELSDTGVFTLHLKDRTCPGPMEPDDRCKVRIRFCPTEIDDYQATLTINGSHKVMIRGKGKLVQH